MLKTGSKIKDNDPRAGTRILTIHDMDNRYAYCKTPWRELTYRILLNRIHADGKERRSGFNLIQQGE